MRDEDGRIPSRRLANPAQQRVHQSQVSGRIRGPERFVEKEQAGAAARAVQAEDLPGEQDALALAFGERSDRPGDQIVIELVPEPALGQRAPGPRRTFAEDFADRHLRGKRARAVLHHVAHLDRSGRSRSDLAQKG